MPETTDRSDPQLQRRLVEQSPDALIFADPAGTIRVWNAGAERLFGWRAAEAEGRNLDLIIPENLRAAHWRGFERAVAAGHILGSGTPAVTRAIHKSGEKRYVELAFGVITADDGRVLGAIATGRDVTQRYLEERAKRQGQSAAPGSPR